MVFKCKMCDATLPIHEGERVVVCEYCGSKQSFPGFVDERLLNLYDRASHYRRNNEFDKAQALYEQILMDNPEDSETYWSVILCKYGIEYVEESGERVPTINRTQTISVLEDENYRKVLRYATPEQSAVYEAEAKRIDEIQKDILLISQKEEPFDIFICYKETDESGRRTLDSVLAADLYEILRNEGYKVFFARVTLDDKFGEAYEPYIFAALQSAKVMISLGTKPEHFDAVWVKNEWSRYLTMIKNGAEKVLIPAYKDMDPYDMPKEFAHLQAINIGELGFQQDLLSGIRKIFDSGEKNAEQNAVVGVNVNGLLNRGFLALEEKEWELAGKCFNEVLEYNKTDVRGYLGRLLLDLKLTDRNELEKSPVPFEDNENYRKILMLGNDEMVLFVTDALKSSKKVAREALYEQTIRIYENTLFEEALYKCAETFERFGDYKDSVEMAKKCREKAAEIKDKKKFEKYAKEEETSRSAREMKRTVKSGSESELLEEFEQESKKPIYVVLGIMGAIFFIIIMILALEAY